MPNSTPSKSDRIAIIGAGAAGISAAYYLKEKGYSNVVIFEALDRIGGKCNSISINGHVYEMGAVYITSSYSEVGQLASKFNVRLGPLQSEDPSLLLDTGTKDGDFHFVSTAESAAMLRAASEYLIKIQQPSTRKIFNPGFSYLDTSLMLPFSDWMKQNSTSPRSLESFFSFTFTPFGYGYLNEVPAAYAIKYYEHKFVSSLTQKSTQLGIIPDGYQNLWKKVVSEEKIDVRVSSAVEKIERRGKDVFIGTRNSTEFEKFDLLINTSPLDTSLQFLDSTCKEKEIFSKVKNYYYYNFAIEIPKNLPSAGYLRINYCSEQQHRPLCWLKRWRDQDIAIFYALSNSPNDTDAVINNIYSDLGAKNIILGKLRESRCWKYFPHFKTEDLQRNIYDDLESLQGLNQTFIAGEIMNFSSVELTTRYSKHLVDRFF